MQLYCTVYAYMFLAINEATVLVRNVILLQWLTGQEGRCQRLPSAVNLQKMEVLKLWR